MILISHPTKQGNVYERAYAAQVGSIPVRYLTGFYGAHMPALLRKLAAIPYISGRLRGLAAKRTHPILSPSSVVSVSSPWLEIARLQIGHGTEWQYPLHDRCVARWLLRSGRSGEAKLIHVFQGAARNTLIAAREIGLPTVWEMTCPPLRDADILGCRIGESLRGRMRIANARVLEAVLREARLADRIIVQSEFGRRRLIEHGIEEHRIDVIPLGVDVERFAPGSWKPTNRLRVVFVGQLCFRKGIDILAEAVNAIDAARIEVMAAGHCVDEVGRRVVKEQRRICYQGVLSDSELISAYQHADLLVMPSRSEGGCNVVMEALACGTPCLVSEGAISIVADSRNGFVIGNGDSVGLASGLIRAGSEPAIVYRLRQAARESALRHSWQTFYQRLCSFYRKYCEVSAEQSVKSREPV